ncbi:MAG TPA: acetylpolyamine aminohydrolase [Deltaproteobacteria bacterium]|nr:acetylpolyamine aminohydrolase [Deltaproteobacteria bacterium]
MRSMPVPYSDLFLTEYATIDCEFPHRVADIYLAISSISEFIEPEPVDVEDLLPCHSTSLVESVQNHPEVFQIAVLSAGGAVKAAEIALYWSPFALIRPLGYHAGIDFNGGFCFFNNIAVAIRKLVVSGLIKKAPIVDIDLHYGNGTVDIFRNDPDVTFRNISGHSRENFFTQFEAAIEDAEGFDIVACSAGFDTYMHDWGQLLLASDFKTVGARIASCHKRIFSVFEGGYYLQDLGKNVRAYPDGFLEACS